MKREPLGTESKIVVCSTTGVMRYLEIQEGKEAMRAMDGARDRDRSYKRVCVSSGL